ncbi:MAG: DUF4286 family protein [Cryomorphaceae bacterium]|nr:DUF4286 family protein [Cryomorphaceae bacterium]
MYIYNVTVNVEKGILDEWLTWMEEIHIPEVLQTKMFENCQINRVLVEEEQGETFAIQYLAKDRDRLKIYSEKFAPALKEKTREKFGDQLVAFRTVLQVVKTFDSNY